MSNLRWTHFIPKWFLEVVRKIKENGVGRLVVIEYGLDSPSYIYEHGF